MSDNISYEELKQRIADLEFQATEKRRQEEALLATEAKLVENLVHNYFLYSCDLKNNLTYVSPTVVNVLGYSPREFLENFTSLLTDNPANQAVVDHCVLSGQAEQPPYEIEIRQKDGSTRWLEITEIPIHGADGHVAAVECIAHNISSRKEAEILLLQEKKKIEAVFATIGDGLSIQDTDYKIIYQNSVHRQRYGDHLEKYCFAAYEKNAAVCDECPLQKCFTDGQVHKIEKTIRTKRSGVIHLEVSAGPILDTQGNIVAGFEIVRDITEHKKLLAQFIHSQKMESVGRLAGGVAHDFNNILTGIIGYSGLCLDQVTENAQLREDIEEIIGLAKRAAELTRQLLAFSRQQTLEPEELNVNSLVANFSKMLKRLIGEDIDLVFTPDPDLGIIKADPGQIEQVLTNLVINARHAMPEGGKLHIETGNVYLDESAGMTHEVDVPPGRYVRLAVSDSGQGIAKEIQNQIFEPFFTTKDVGEGSGLGLSTVYGIVKQHKGFVWVYSEPGQGTTIKVYLPQQTDDIDSGQAGTGAKEQKKIPRGSETILMVEDEPAVRLVTDRMLTRMGYTVFSTSDPDDAENILREHGGKIDLMITDVVMPNVNGKELYRRLVKIKPDLKVLYMSGYTQDVIAHKGVLEDDTAFINKPFSQEDLGNKIRSILSP